MSPARSVRAASSGCGGWIGLSTGCVSAWVGRSMASRQTQSKYSLSRPRRQPTRSSRPRGPEGRRVALAKMKGELSRYLRLAEAQEIVITRHGRPAGVLIGFQSDENWFEYQLERNPEFLRRIARGRAEIQ